MLLIVLIATAARLRRLWPFVSFFIHLPPFVIRLTYSRNHPGRSCTSSAAVGCQSCREGQARRAQGSQGQWHRSARWRWRWKSWYRHGIPSSFFHVYIPVNFFFSFPRSQSWPNKRQRKLPWSRERTRSPQKLRLSILNDIPQNDLVSGRDHALHNVVLTKGWEVETGPFHALVLLEDPEVEPSITPALHEEEGCLTLVPVLDEADIGLFIALLLHGINPWSTLLPHEANLGPNLALLLPDKTQVHPAPLNLS